MSRSTLFTSRPNGNLKTETSPRRDPVVLGPRRPEGSPGPGGPPRQIAEQAHPTKYHLLPDVEVHLPAARGATGEVLAVHHRSARASFRRRRCTAMSSEKRAAARSEIQRPARAALGSRRTPPTSPPPPTLDLRDRAAVGRDIETPALVVDGCRCHARFDELDPPAVHDLGRASQLDRPADGRHRKRSREDAQEEHVAPKGRFRISLGAIGGAL